MIDIERNNLSFMSSQQFLSYTEYLHVIYVENWTVCVESYVHWQESIPIGCVPPACKLYMLKWSPPDVTPECYQVNKFEQVSSVGHQMSVKWWGQWVPGLMLEGWGWGGPRFHVRAVGFGGFLYSQVQSIMDNGHMGTPCGQTERQKYKTENIIFPQLRW